MPELVPAILILVVGAAGLALLWRFGAWVPASVQTFRRLASRQGINVQSPVSERILRRAPALRRLQDATDVGRLLQLAGQRQGAATWLLRQAGTSVLLAALLLVLDLATLGLEGRLAFPVYLAFAFGAAWWLLGYVRLRNAAQHRREALERAVAQGFVELALLTHTRQLPVAVALEEVLAPAQDDGTLRGLFAGAGWRQLVEADARSRGEVPGLALQSSADIYSAIGESYGIPALGLLGTSLHRINDKGQAPAEVLTALARTAADEQVADMLVRTEQSRVRQAIPVGLMVLPLLALVGFPLLAALQGMFS
ncbi:MAG: hypothetical protein WAM30_19105 [Candidatus Dormiibacterota bacterium]